MENIGLITNIAIFNVVCLVVLIYFNEYCLQSRRTFVDPAIMLTLLLRPPLPTWGWEGRPTDITRAFSDNDKSVYKDSNPATEGKSAPSTDQPPCLNPCEHHHTKAPPKVKNHFVT